MLDGAGVDHLWLRGWHVDWQTGAPGPRRAGRTGGEHPLQRFRGRDRRTPRHRVLHPPQHRQNLLANAQLRWLAEQGGEKGWAPLAGPREAEERANRGELVLAVWQNPNPRRPGHIAIIRPSEKTDAQLDADGPEETQAGTRNYLDTTIASASATTPEGRAPLLRRTRDAGPRLAKRSSTRSTPGTSFSAWPAAA